MKRKVLSIVLALLMCMTVTVPTFAESSEDAPGERAVVSITFSLDQVSGSTYKMWAQIGNPMLASITVILVLYDVYYNTIAAIGTTTSDPIIYISKQVSLSPGVYHLRISVQGGGISKIQQKNYTIS